MHARAAVPQSMIEQLEGALVLVEPSAAAEALRGTGMPSNVAGLVIP